MGWLRNSQQGCLVASIHPAAERSSSQEPLGAGQGLRLQVFLHSPFGPSPSVSVTVLRYHERPHDSHYGHDYRNVDHHEERHQGGEGNEVYHHRQDTRKSSESLPHHQRERRGSWGQAPLPADEVFGVDLHVRGLPAQAPNARLVYHSSLLVALFVHTASAFRAGLEVDGASFHRQRRLTEGLRKRRVSMHGHPELLGRPLDELGEDALGYEVGNVRAHGVHAQDQIRLRVHDHLDESPLLALDEGFGQREEREPAHLYLVALLPSLIFG